MKTVIFDLDGTLADTSGDLIAAANACLVEMGLGRLLDPARDQAVAVTGVRNMLALAFARAGRGGAEEVEAQFPRVVQAYDANIDTYTVLYPGAMDAVEALKTAGYGVGIATNKPEAQSEKLLRRLGIRDAFASLVCADTLPVRKPDPEHLFEAARRAGGDPAKTCLVGDSDTDRNTARNANVPSILVAFGPAGDEVAALEPEALLQDFADLPAIVERLIGPATH